MKKRNDMTVLTAEERNPRTTQQHPIFRSKEAFLGLFKFLWIPKVIVRFPSSILLLPHPISLPLNSTFLGQNPASVLASILIKKNKLHEELSAIEKQVTFHHIKKKKL